MIGPGRMLVYLLWGALTAFLVPYSYHAHQRETMLVRGLVNLQRGCEALSIAMANPPAKPQTPDEIPEFHPARANWMSRHHAPQ